MAMESELEKEQADLGAFKGAAEKQRLIFEGNDLLTMVRERVFAEAEVKTMKER